MNIKKLLDTIRVETDVLYWILFKELKALGLKLENEWDDWIYVDNASPIMLVAHIDTVTRNKKLKFRVKRNRIRARNSVLGADDRAGIYAIMEILRMCKTSNVPMPSVLFTNYEESGMQGVEAFVKSKKMEKNMNIFIELDRKGKDEYVYYFHEMPKPISEWVESFGFTKDHGSMSDVMTLTEEYSIPHVNLSVGYYDQHTSKETLYPSQLQLTIDRVFQMMINPLEELHEVNGKSCGYDYWYDDYYQMEYGIYGGTSGYSGRGWRNTSPSNSDVENMYINNNKLVPKSFNYTLITDTLEEIQYETESSDIPWDEEDIVEVFESEIIDFPSDDYNETKNIKIPSIHGMTEEQYYDYYGWN